MATPRTKNRAKKLISEYPEGTKNLQTLVDWVVTVLIFLLRRHINED